MLRLDDLIGKKLLVTLLDSNEPSYTVTLHGVESGGLWLEGSQLEKLADFLVPKPKVGQPQKKPVFFVPYARIEFLIALSTNLD